MATRKRDHKIPIMGKAKGSGAIRRMQNRKPVTDQPTAQPSQQEIDIQIVDLILRALYNNGDSVVKSLTTDILDTLKIEYNEKGLDRTWDVIINTGLVSPIVGFNSNYKLELTTDGYKIMSQYGSYINYINEIRRHSEMQNPHYVTKQENEEVSEQDKGNIDNAAHTDQNNNLTDLSI